MGALNGDRALPHPSRDPMRRSVIPTIMLSSRRRSAYLSGDSALRDRAGGRPWSRIPSVNHAIAAPRRPPAAWRSSCSPHGRPAAAAGRFTTTTNHERTAGARVINRVRPLVRPAPRRRTVLRV